MATVPEPPLCRDPDVKPPRPATFSCFYFEADAYSVSQAGLEPEVLLWLLRYSTKADHGPWQMGHSPEELPGLLLL